MKEILLSEVSWLTPRQVTLLKKCNINTIEDLLFNYPSKFEDYTIVSYDNANVNETVTIEGVVCSKATVANVKTKLSVMNFFADVNQRKVRITIFNRHFLKTKLSYGTYIKITGKFNDNKSNFIASEIHFDEFSNDINPVFNIKGISDEKMLEIKKKAFEEYQDEITDNLPDDIRKKNKLIPLKRAIKYINIPESVDEIKLAIKRIKFSELLEYQLKVKYLFYMRKKFPCGMKIDYDSKLVNNFIDQLPFKLTIDQTSAVEAILSDMGQTYQMNRLLQGEVGSGKTIVAAIALYAAITGGFQGALMVPTEVLAKQHYVTFIKLFEKFNVNVRLLVSSLSTKEKKEILDDLECGKINIIIGTHSLFQKDVNFYKLGLVVTDEEHRFGVKQRVSILGKGYLIDHLKMSATPIPRTLAISVLGDSDFSIIKTLPGNKKEVITKYVPYEERAPIFEHIKEELSRGRQIYIIAPMIDESDSMDLSNAINVYENTKQYFDGICNVGLIHGRLKTEEKEEVMKKFYDNEYQILISTSIIEVGVNVENATTIVILDADRFGIAQLHQMRGRVRRSDYQAYCFLVSKSTTQSSINRLVKVEQNSDGFTLAEEDLLTRGAGDIFGEKQSGNLVFKMADIVLDKDLLEIANNEADNIINSGQIFTDEYKKLYEIVDTNYQTKKEFLN